MTKYARTPDPARPEVLHWEQQFREKVMKHDRLSHEMAAQANVGEAGSRETMGNEMENCG